MTEKIGVGRKRTIGASCGALAGLAIALYFGVWHFPARSQAVTSISGTPPPASRSSADLHGWDKITWGMPFNEINQLYGTTATIKEWRPGDPIFGRETAYLVITGIQI